MQYKNRYEISDEELERIKDMSDEILINNSLVTIEFTNDLKTSYDALTDMLDDIDTKAYDNLNEYICENICNTWTLWDKLIQYSGETNITYEQEGGIIRY